MTTKKYSILTIAVIVQSIVLINMFTPIYSKWPTQFYFLFGIDRDTIYQMLIIWFMFYACLSFSFFGVLSQNLYGFGKYLLIRNYSKGKFLVNQYLSAALHIVIFMVIQCSIYGIMTLVMQKPLHLQVNMIKLGKALWLYYLTLLTLILLQMLLELYISSHFALVIINIYVIFSILFASIIFKYQLPEYLLYALLPNFMMGLRTDILNSKPITIHYSIALCVVLVLIVFMMILSIRKIKSKDIF